jgi:hypothetical protein
MACVSEAKIGSLDALGGQQDGVTKYGNTLVFDGQRHAKTVVGYFEIQPTTPKCDYYHVFGIGKDQSVRYI